MDRTEVTEEQFAIGIIDILKAHVEEMIALAKKSFDIDNIFDYKKLSKEALAVNRRASSACINYQREHTFLFKKKMSAKLRAQYKEKENLEYSKLSDYFENILNHNDIDSIMSTQHSTVYESMKLLESGLDEMDEYEYLYICVKYATIDRDLNKREIVNVELPNLE